MSATSQAHLSVSVPALIVAELSYVTRERGNGSADALDAQTSKRGGSGLRAGYLKSSARTPLLSSARTPQETVEPRTGRMPSIRTIAVTA